MKIDELKPFDGKRVRLKAIDAFVPDLIGELTILKATRGASLDCYYGLLVLDIERVSSIDELKGPQPIFIGDSD